MNRRDFVGHLAAAAAAPFIRVSPDATPLRVNGARVNGWLAQFDAIGRTAGRHQSRRLFRGRPGRPQFTLGLFREAGLTPRIDAAGNIVGRLEGTEPALPPILIGSHVDSVTDGGNFDGPVGSFGAIEVARSLREQDVRLRHPLEVVVWQNEEGGTIGSKLAIGVTRGRGSRRGRALGQDAPRGHRPRGRRRRAAREAVRTRGSVHGYFELHIEQGGLLERAGPPIGTVTGIVGLRWLDVAIDGFSNHAGTTPMDQRQDAMLAAARFTVAVNDAIRARARPAGRDRGAHGRLAEHAQRHSRTRRAHRRPARSRRRRSSIVSRPAFGSSRPRSAAPTGTTFTRHARPWTASRRCPTRG